MNDIRYKNLQKNTILEMVKLRSREKRDFAA
jgi:hypothetical protein